MPRGHAAAQVRRRLALYAACAWHDIEARVVRTVSAAGPAHGARALCTALALPADASLDAVHAAVRALFEATRARYTLTPAMEASVRAAATMDPEPVSCRAPDVERLLRWCTTVWHKAQRARVLAQQVAALEAELRALT